MSEGGAAVENVAALSGAQLLELAVDRLLTESPCDLPEQVALDRARTLLACSERLTAARLAAVRDVDRRELFALDAAGSTRGWLRNQPGGENGQLSAARRLGERPLVEAALAEGSVSGRAAEQLCAVLDKVPAQLPEPLVQAVLLDGIGGQLRSFTGGLVPDDEVTPDLLAARAEAEVVLQAAAADTAAEPARRLEPALVLLGTRLTASHLGPALRELLGALLPDGADGMDRDPYFFELRELLDGDVDVRGHLTPEVGHGLAAEIARRVAHAKAEAKKAAASDPDAAPASHCGPGPVGGPDALRADDGPDDAADALLEEVDVEPDAGAGAVRQDVAAQDPTADRLRDWDDAFPTDAVREDVAAQDPPADGLQDWDDAFAAAGQREAERAPGYPDAGRTRPVSAGRRRHDALAQLLHDLAAAEPGSGRPAPHRLTIIATLDALERRLGALPAQLTTHGPPATLTEAQLQRLACSSDLDAVLLDALGNPVGASHPRRNLTRRERRALRAQWGTTCAVAGCPSTVTVPHHVEPFWLTGISRLRDIVPACEHCHHDLHDGHRTLRLRDGRLINEYGWVTRAVTAA